MDVPTLHFRFSYGEQMVYCLVRAYEGYYAIHLNRTTQYEIQMNDYCNWMLTGGSILPQAIIDGIGTRIEDRFE